MSVTKKVLTNVDALERLLKAHPIAHLTLHEQRRYDDLEDIRIPQEEIDDLRDAIARARAAK